MYPSVNTLCAMVNCDRRSLQRGRQLLVTLGVLVIQDHSGGRSKTAAYRWDFDRLAALTETEALAAIEERRQKRRRTTRPSESPKQRDVRRSIEAERAAPEPEKGGAGAQKGRRQCPETAAQDPPDPSDPTDPVDPADVVLRLYSTGYERKIGEPYAFRPNARQQATELLKTASPLRIRRVIAAFFDFAADDWFQREGYPFAAFVRQFVKLAAKADHAAAGDDTRPPEWDRNARARAEAKKRPSTPMPDSLKRQYRALATHGDDRSTP